MKNLFLLGLLIMPLIGCSASIGPDPYTRTTYVRPAVSSTTYTAVPTRTTVTRTTY